MRRGKSIHPIIYTAVGMFLGELLIANPTAALYEWLTGRELWLPDFVPPGFLFGAGLGLFIGFAFLRFREPLWYTYFYKNRKTYENKIISIKSIELHFVYDERPIVENRTFVDCEFIGPGIVALDELKELVHCEFHQSGIPIKVNLNHPIAGCLVFRGCIFRNCKFRRVQFLLGPDVYDALLSGSNLGSRDTN